MTVCRKYVEVKGNLYNDTFTVWLKVGSQSFLTHSYPWETLDEAEWFALQLTRALDNIVEKETGPVLELLNKALDLAARSTKKHEELIKAVQDKLLRNE